MTIKTFRDGTITFTDAPRPKGSARQRRLTRQRRMQARRRGRPYGRTLSLSLSFERDLSVHV